VVAAVVAAGRRAASRTAETAETAETVER
jgi:hypothetical protein